MAVVNIVTYGPAFELGNGTRLDGTVYLDDGNIIDFSTYDMYVDGVNTTWTTFTRR